LFDKIDRGMTVDQLVALAGKPNGDDDMTRFNNPDVDRRLSWDDYVADIAIRVDIVKGKVVSKQGSSRGTHWAVVYPSGPAPAPAKPVRTLTRASFEKIDKGMSTDDVIALIGQPSATVGLDPTKFGVDTQMEFVSIGGNGGVAATVYLLQSKVVKKTNPQN